MSEQTREILRRFDELLDKAQSADTKLLVEALKLQTQLMDLRLAVVEHLSTGSSLGSGKRNA